LITRVLALGIGLLGLVVAYRHRSRLAVGLTVVCLLRIHLKNPADAKSDTQMPNLNLSEEEIEALIAFINS